MTTSPNPLPNTQPTSKAATVRATQPARGTAQRDPRGYVRVAVPNPRTGDPTTISLSATEWKQALGYTGGNSRGVTAALRHVAKLLDHSEVLSGDFSLLVRRKALARLRGLVGARPTLEAQLASANNAAWGGVQ